MLLVTAGGLLCGQPTALAEPEPSTESSAESAAPSPTPSPAASPTPSPAATPTENASEPSAEAPKLGVAGGHEVTYTITATSDLTGNISYIKTDPPSMAAYNANLRSTSRPSACRSRRRAGGLHHHAGRSRPVGAGHRQWGLRINPEFHCEIAVDGEVVVSQQGAAAFPAPPGRGELAPIQSANT